MLRRAMAHENTALFHLNRTHTTQNEPTEQTEHFAHKLVYKKKKFITRLELERVGKYNAMAPTTYLFLLKPQRLVPSCKKKKSEQISPA